MPPYSTVDSSLPTKRIFAGIIAVVGVIVALLVGTMALEKIDANEILIVQGVGGGLSVHTKPGIHKQAFGRVIIFPKVLDYDFSGKIRFNDNGHGTVVGSTQFRLPLDSANLINIYQTYGSADALQSKLLSVVTDKSIFMAGPLLSSTESASEKRSNLIYWIEDQIINGVYRTNRRDIKTKDPITGEEKTITVAEIALEKDGKTAQRQESSQLISFGLVPFNFAVKDVGYDETVEKQIQVQQQNIMAVQTAVAESRRAEQQTLTAEQQGRALAAKAKWDQEAIKAKVVTEAQQKLEVATLDAKAAEAEKRANILRGEGEAGRRRAVMLADNALEKKAEVWLEAQKVWAEAVSKYGGQWVPSVVMGGNASGGNGAQALMDLLTAKTARDLGLDMTVKNRSRSDE